MYKLPITLDLSYNKLKKMPPPKMKVPQIHVVDVSHNLLSQLPANVNNLQCMTRLDLSNNQMTDISDQLGLTKYIRYLDLSYNELTQLPESLCALGYAIDELRVTNNRLTTLPQNVDNFKVCVQWRRHMSARPKASRPRPRSGALIPSRRTSLPFGRYSLRLPS